MALAHYKQNGTSLEDRNASHLYNTHTIHVFIGHSQTKLPAIELTNPTKVQRYWQNQGKLRSERHYTYK